MVAFRCYNPSGTKDRGFHAWCDELPPEFRSAVDVELELAGRDKTLEESGRFKDLRGKCLGLTEILIDSRSTWVTAKRITKKFTFEFLVSGPPMISFCSLASANAAVLIMGQRVIRRTIENVE